MSFDGAFGSLELHRALRRLTQLQDEVVTLRQTLLETQRALALKAVLLHNARCRELELRAQLVKDWV